MNTIIINGVTIQASGSISVRNGRVTVNGQDVTPDAKQITISVTGNVDALEVDACTSLSVEGDVNTLRAGSADISVAGSVGSLSTGSGDVDCAQVNGNVSTGSGDVTCGNVGGSVRTGSGDIKHKK